MLVVHLIVGTLVSVLVPALCWALGAPIWGLVLAYLLSAPAGTLLSALAALARDRGEAAVPRGPGAGLVGI